jgi:hypothetical protein
MPVQELFTASEAGQAVESVANILSGISRRSSLKTLRPDLGFFVMLALTI